MTKQLEVGKTYTAVDGLKWRCISLDGDVAYMRLDLAKHAPAHTWSLDGNPISLAGDSNSIVFEPERGEVVLNGRRVEDGCRKWAFDNWAAPGDYRLAIPTLDGELATGLYYSPDGHQIKVEKL